MREREREGARAREGWREREGWMREGEGGLRTEGGGGEREREYHKQVK